LEQHKAHAKVLEKMYMEQILTRTEMSEFGKSLQRHQTVKLADGFTILEKAIVEHNTVAASKARPCPSLPPSLPDSLIP